jgi:hypothetical protein
VTVRVVLTVKGCPSLVSLVYGQNEVEIIVLVARALLARGITAFVFGWSS